MHTVSLNVACIDATVPSPAQTFPHGCMQSMELGGGGHIYVVRGGLYTDTDFPSKPLAVHVYCVGWGLLLNFCMFPATLSHECLNRAREMDALYPPLTVRPAWASPHQGGKDQPPLHAASPFWLQISRPVHFKCLLLLPLSPSQLFPTPVQARFACCL